MEPNTYLLRSSYPYFYHIVETGKLTSANTNSSHQDHHFINNNIYSCCMPSDLMYIAPFHGTGILCIQKAMPIILLRQAPRCAAEKACRHGHEKKRNSKAQADTIIWGMRMYADFVLCRRATRESNKPCSRRGSMRFVRNEEQLQRRHHDVRREYDYASRRKDDEIKENGYSNNEPPLSCRSTRKLLVKAEHRRMLHSPHLHN
jgi:hypothetical protein